MVSTQPPSPSRVELQLILENLAGIDDRKMFFDNLKLYRHINRLYEAVQRMVSRRHRAVFFPNGPAGELDWGMTEGAAGKQ